MKNNIEDILKLIIEGKFKDYYAYRIKYLEMWVVVNDQTIIVKKNIRVFRKYGKATIKFSDKNILDIDYYLCESRLPILKSFGADISLYNDLRSKLLEEDNIKKEERKKKERAYEKAISDELASIVNRNKQ